jgi:phenylacetate-CoA ligase
MISAAITTESAPFSRLLELLAHWREIPLYRDRIAMAAGGFFQLPFVTKRDMRENFPHNFLRPGQNLDALLDEKLVELEHTSGTSDDRTAVLLGRGWWDQQELRALRLNHFVAKALASHAGPRRATLTTPACNGMACPSRWLTRSQRTLGSTLSVNQARIPFLLTDEELSRMAAEVAEWSPLFLDLDPVHGVWFALYCERHGIRFPALKFVLCSYEFVSVVHRKVIERAFGVPVLNFYGSTETGHLLMEDGQGDMQPSVETAYLEIVDADSQGAGDLVVTTLTNDYMPLVRYHIGDLVEKRADGYIVHGRKRDALQSTTGQRVTTWQVDQCFNDISGIAHYQLRPNAPEEFHLRFVRDGNGPTAEAMRELISRLENVLQTPGKISNEAVDVLVPSPSGKFRLTIPNEN